MCDKSSCTVKTGAVAVVDGGIIASGYNELLPLSENLPERDNVIHAEAFLVADAARKGVSLDGSTLYVTRFPCPSCARLVYRAGIRNIFYMSDLFTAGNEALPLFAKLGVKIEQITEDVVWKVC